MKRARWLLLLLPAAGGCEKEVGDGATFSAIVTVISFEEGGSPSNGASQDAALSEDGTLVAFSTDATTLGFPDTNGKRDIVLRNRRAGTYERISVSMLIIEADGDSSNPAVSADGSYVVFESKARLTSPTEPTDKRRIYLRDRTIPETKVVSVTASGGWPTQECLNPSISSDGRYAAFETNAPLGVGSSSGIQQVYVRDMLKSPGTAGWLTLISHDKDDNNLDGNNMSKDTMISADGEWVVFWSSATNLKAGISTWQVYLARRDGSGMEVVSLAPITGAVMADVSDDLNPSISRNGRYVAFETSATNFVSQAGIRQVFRRDRTLLKTERVSVTASGGEPNDDCDNPFISPDGRFVSFVSNATDLVPGVGATYHVLLRDMEGGTVLVSRSSQGEAANHLGDLGTRGRRVSSGGFEVVFDSLATNLVSGDTNGVRDVFIYAVAR